MPVNGAPGAQRNKEQETRVHVLWLILLNYMMPKLNTIVVKNWYWFHTPEPGSDLCQYSKQDYWTHSGNWGRFAKAAIMALAYFTVHYAHSIISYLTQIHVLLVYDTFETQFQSSDVFRDKLFMMNMRWVFMLFVDVLNLENVIKLQLYHVISCVSCSLNFNIETFSLFQSR